MTFIFGAFIFLLTTYCIGVQRDMLKDILFFSGLIKVTLFHIFLPLISPLCDGARIQYVCCCGANGRPGFFSAQIGRVNIPKLALPGTNGTSKWPRSSDKGMLVCFYSHFPSIYAFMYT